MFFFARCIVANDFIGYVPRGTNILIDLKLNYSYIETYKYF